MLATENVKVFQMAEQLETTPNIITSDDWETPLWAWRAITRGIPKYCTLWDPFYCEGRSRIYLQDLGFTVAKTLQTCDMTTNGTCDCMNQADPQFDVLVTNPPFSQLESVVPWVIAKEKPSIVLMPEAATKKQWFLDLMQCCTWRIVYPGNRIHFIQNGKYKEYASFDSVWVVLNMGADKKRKRK